MQNTGSNHHPHQEQPQPTSGDLQPFSGNSASQPWSRNQVPLPVKNISNVIVLFGGIGIVGFILGIVIANFLVS